MRLVACTLAAAALAAAATAAPAQAVIRGEGRLDRGDGFLPLRLTVRNVGDEPFSVFRFTGRVGHAFGTPTPSSGTCTRAVTAAGPSLFCNADVAPGQTLTVDFNAEPRYPDGGGGLLGVQASLQDTRIHESQVPGPGEAPAQAPAAGRSERVEPVSGTVRIRLRGSGRFVTLRAGQLVPDGSELDTRNGVARVVVAATRDGAQTSSALVSEGRAIIDQNRAARPLTTLRLSEPIARPPRGRASAAARRKKRRGLFVQHRRRPLPDPRQLRGGDGQRHRVADHGSPGDHEDRGAGGNRDRPRPRAAPHDPRDRAGHLHRTARPPAAGAGRRRVVERGPGELRHVRFAPLPRPASQPPRSRSSTRPWWKASSTSRARFSFCGRSPIPSLRYSARRWTLTASTPRNTSPAIVWFVAGVA